MSRLAALLVVLMALASVAHADPRKEAKAHFAQGKAYHDAGAYDDAIKEYDVAYKLAPLPPILFNIAQCYRLKGDKKDALDYYQRYVTAQPEGDIADEAREHIANLKLRLEVEEAEAARQRALQEAAEAKRRADEAELEKRRALDEQTRKRQGADDDEARIRAIADELQRRRAQERADAELAQHRRVAAARAEGQKWIKAGGLTVGAGLLVFLLGWAPIVDGAIRDNNLHFLSPNMTAWTTQNENDARMQGIDSKIALGMWLSGGIIAVAGVTVCIVGVKKRNALVEKAETQP